MQINIEVEKKKNIINSFELNNSHGSTHFDDSHLQYPFHRYGFIFKYVSCYHCESSIRSDISKGNCFSCILKRNNQPDVLPHITIFFSHSKKFSILQEKKNYKYHDELDNDSNNDNNNDHDVVFDVDGIGGDDVVEFNESIKKII